MCTMNFILEGSERPEKKHDSFSSLEKAVGEKNLVWLLLGWETCHSPEK